MFQALRIEVNAELAAVERAIPAALEVLPVGGRIVVLSYQSLEDRIVKRALSAATASTAPSGLPVELPEHAPRFRLLVKGAELADEEERARNPRATPGATARRRESEGCRMSAATASALRPERRRPRRARPAPARRLRAVDALAPRRKRPRLAYAIVAVAGAIAIGTAQMALSIGTTQASYEIAQLNSQVRDLTYQKQALYDDVAGLSSPQYLAANAAALGHGHQRRADLPAPERRRDHRHRARWPRRPRRWMPWAAARSRTRSSPTPR